MTYHNFARKRTFKTIIHAEEFRYFNKLFFVILIKINAMSVASFDFFFKGYK